MQTAPAWAPTHRSSTSQVRASPAKQPPPRLLAALAWRQILALCAVHGCLPCQALHQLTRHACDFGPLSSPGRLSLPAPCGGLPMQSLPAPCRGLPMQSQQPGRSQAGHPLLPCRPDLPPRRRRVRSHQRHLEVHWKQDALQGQWGSSKSAWWRWWCHYCWLASRHTLGWGGGHLS
jgi:hypothetical protein